MRVPLFLCAALAACQPASEASPGSDGAAPTASPAPSGAASSTAPPAPEPPPSPNAIRTPGELVGEYRLAGVGGEAIDLPHGISVSITPTRIDVSSQCVRFVWSYRFEGARLRTEPVPVVSCERALLPEEAAIERAFGAASSVARTNANGVEFSGAGGHSVTLFGQ